MVWSVQNCDRPRLGDKAGGSLVALGALCHLTCRIQRSVEKTTWIRLTLACLCGFGFASRPNSIPIQAQRRSVLWLCRRSRRGEEWIELGKSVSQDCGLCSGGCVLIEVGGQNGPPPSAQIRLPLSLLPYAPILARLGLIGPSGTPLPSQG